MEFPDGCFTPPDVTNPAKDIEGRVICPVKDRGHGSLLLKLNRKEEKEWRRKENQRPMFLQGRRLKAGYSAAVAAETR